MNQTVFLSLIVPVYNEEARFHLPLLHVHRYLEANFENWEILYVDDGSQDGTYSELLEAEKAYRNFRVLHYPSNRGKGYAVRKGMAAAMGNVLLFSDADFSTPIEETEKLLRYLFEGWDIAIGSRAVPGSNVEVHQSWKREALGKMGNQIIRAVLPLPFHDTQCGFKMFRRHAVEILLPKLTIDGFAFDIEMLTIAQVHGLKVAEVPVTWRNVVESKVRPIHSVQVLWDVFQIKYRLALKEYS